MSGEGEAGLAAGETLIVSGAREFRALRRLGIFVAKDAPYGRTSIQQLFRTVTAKHPNLNVLVTMAGIMAPERILHPDSIDVAERVIATNLRGPTRLIHIFAQHLVSSRLPPS